MKQAVVVAVVSSRRHPIYRKAVKRTKHFVAHVEGNEYEVGDVVKIEETKPMSKTKHFIVLSKVAK